VSTVTIPRTICPRSKMNVRVANLATLFFNPYFFSARAVVAMTSRVTTIVHTLCVYSITTAGVNEGITWPWQSGQSGQAKPEPVEETIPPRTIRVYTEPDVRSDNHWNEFSLKATDPRILLARAAS